MHSLEPPVLSVFMPTIRTHLLPDWLSSLEKSCSRHSFEVVLCGPFEPPKEVLERNDVTWLSSYASPTVCAQKCVEFCNGMYLLHSVDDAIYFPGVVSDEIDRIENDVLTAMRYREGQDYNGNELADSYWYAGTAYSGWPNIKPEWGHCVHFMCWADLFLKTGGFDCRYEYLNHATHDWLFRLQKHSGIRYRLSENEITTCDWQPNTTGDHEAIHNAQTQHDQQLFAQEWGYGTGSQLVIDFDNYKSQPEVWNRRFTGKEEKYGDLS